MNCKSCQKSISQYIDGKAPDDIALQVKTHLNGCEECQQVYTSQLITNKVINEEKAATVNPFLSTRVMAGIEKLQNPVKPSFIGKRVLQPVFLSIAVGLALIIGISVGNTYNKSSIQQTIPEELVYIDGVAMESLYVFTNE